MSAAHDTKLHPNEKIKLGRDASKLTTAGIAMALIGLVLSLILSLGNTEHFRRFFFSYLTAYAWCLSIAVGALFFVLIQHLTRARASVAYRRIGEMLTLTFPMLLVMSLVFLIPMLAGNTTLYSWLEPDPLTAPHLAHKATWLSAPFFAGRIVFYLLVFTAISRWFYKTSAQQDESGDAKLSDKMRVVSGPTTLIFALITAMTGFDLLMSIEPTWFSTIYGVWFFGGGVVAFYAFLALATAAIQRTGRLTHSVTTEHYHDMGKMMFAFLMFWAYVSFSQFLLIWYGNMPEETFWYHPRMFTDWQYVSWFILFGAFAVPYPILMSRWTKRIAASRTVVAVWLLLCHYIDIYWNVMPSYDGTKPTFAAIDLGTFLLAFGLFLAAFGRALGKGNLIATKDPTLGVSLSFQNY
jgi:hypothetical protein